MIRSSRPFGLFASTSELERGEAVRFRSARLAGPPADEFHAIERMTLPLDSAILDGAMAVLFSNHAIVDEYAGAFLPIAHLIFDSLNQEITIDNGGKVYVDRGSGALRFTGITIPEVQLRAAIRMLVAASGAYIDREYAANSLTLACGARFSGSLPPFGDEPQISIRLHSGMGRPVSDFMTAGQVRLVTEASRGAASSSAERPRAARARCSM